MSKMKYLLGIGVFVFFLASLSFYFYGVPTSQAQNNLVTAPDTIIATVNGINIGGKALSGQKALLKQANPNLGDVALTKQAFNILRRNAVAQAEAKNRGISVTPQDVQTFTNDQRQMVEKAPKDSEVYKTFRQEETSLGFTDDNAYWTYKATLYAPGLYIAKLRDQIGSQAGAKTYSDLVKAYNQKLNDLDKSATVIILDNTLKSALSS